MVFSSSFFVLVFLPIFLLVYFLIPYKWKNTWALFSSLAFYAWGAPLFVFVLIGSVLIDYSIVKYKLDQLHRKRWFIISIVLNVGLLAYFKYANFFVENFNSLLNQIGLEETKWTKVILPIGISFFTFQKISYLVDVYRQIRKPLQRFSDHLLYVVLFPQLIAGPIVRYNEIAGELINRMANINANNRLLGLFRFSIGLGKKVLIANVLGEAATEVFEMETNELNSAYAWYGAICYTFQIYFDFSGYSDMAIGIGKMLGFTFPENFNNPYISKSISEFWRRWHITLSNWMRDYLYIPLGGNKVSSGRLYFNLGLVFLISGLWHGASWTFIFWGIYHGFFLIMERLILNKLYTYLPGFIRIIITFFIVLIGWVFFKSETFEYAFYYIHQLLLFDFGFDYTFWTNGVMRVLFIAALFSFFAVLPKVEKWQMKMLNRDLNFSLSIVYPLLSLIILLTCVSFMTTTNFNPFIYFRF